MESFAIHAKGTTVDAREGIEDYEYVQLAEARGIDWRAYVVNATDGTTSCDKKPCPIAQDTKYWTKDPSAFMNARIALGQALHAASSP